MNKNYIGYLSPFLQKNVIPTIAPETTYKFGIIESPLILFNINICKLFFFTEEETMTSHTDYTNLQWWKKYLRISLRFKKFQKCPLPLAQCWDRHAFLPQVPTSTTFPTLKVGRGGFFSKYFFQGCLKNYLHSNNVCMYFGGNKNCLR